MTSKSFQKLLTDRIMIADGAMGTMLYNQGIFLNACFDELNLVNPALIKRVHDGYVGAGADFIETNTFGANEFKLAAFGLADRVEQINEAATAIAKSSASARPGVLVAGSIGPLGFPVQPIGQLTRQQAHDAFARQANALAKAGVDFLMLETFTDPNELLTAIEAAAATGLAIVAQMTTNEHHETMYGQKIQDAISLIAAHDAVTAVGLNCSVGPSEMLASLELLRGVTDKPIAIQPNAGMPRQVDGRMLYMSTPEYMAEYAKRFFEKGARIIGGCCGTTPDHIREIVKAVRPLDKATAQRPEKITVGVAERPKPTPQQAKPLAEKSRLGQKLAAGQTVITIELTPPRGIDITTMLEKVHRCAAAGIDAVNIPDGPRASSRLSPMITAVKIEQSCKIETILHVCCRDRNIIGLQSDMLGAYAIGLRNVLLITGDPPKLGEYPDATAVYDVDSIALTRLVANMNMGIDIGSNTFSPPLGLTIGVGANPVAVDLPREIERFRQKVEAGAEYAITQPVFDASSLFNFIEAAKNHTIPLIAGIWPFSSFKNAEFMANEVPGVVVPQRLLDRMSTATTRSDGLRLGVEIAQEMIEQIKDHVAGFAVSAPFGNIDVALAVLGKFDINKL
ncbi:MAG: bifunctional homocysteine S-methyltransferase/methylenetetrahydrofolate reductase [Sedimentisphaerales bacterium]|nr:bifunctional homocysteine S-methyltransferase/methylenetetrahydrofolate reductase [Sedimentisphaerales bacterium]